MAVIGEAGGQRGRGVSGIPCLRAIALESGREDTAWQDKYGMPDSPPGDRPLYSTKSKRWCGPPHVSRIVCPGLSSRGSRGYPGHAATNASVFSPVTSFVSLSNPGASIRKVYFPRSRSASPTSAPGRTTWYPLSVLH